LCRLSVLSVPSACKNSTRACVFVYREKQAERQPVEDDGRSGTTMFRSAAPHRAHATVRRPGRAPALLSVLTASALTAAVLVPASASAAPVVLSAGASAAASSSNAPYLADNLTDGDRSTYWESTNNSLPQWAQVDLGAGATGEEVVLALPAGWEARTQTLTVQAGADASSFTTLAASAEHRFDPASGNTVTIDVPDTEARYVRVAITANTGWPAGQLSELEVRGTREAPEPEGPVEGTDLAAGRPTVASSTEWTYVAANATDGDTGTYWEGAGGQYPSTLAVTLESAAELEAVVVKLPPATAWGPRTQTFEVQGRAGSGDAWETLAASAGHAFSPATGNAVTVPVSGTAREVRLRFTGNTGAGNGQVAELQVFGAPAAGPNLTVTGVTADPASPTESDDVTLSATVKNIGTLASAATDVSFTLDGDEVGTAEVGALAAGAEATVSAETGSHAAGSYELGAEVDLSGAVAEQSEADNGYAHPDPLVVTEVESSDLVPTVTW